MTSWEVAPSWSRKLAHSRSITLATLTLMPHITVVIGAEGPVIDLGSG